MYKKIILTEREQEIINLISQIHNLKTLASDLGISYRTLQWHLGKLYAKFRVRNRFELVMDLIENKPDYVLR